MDIRGHEGRPRRDGPDRQGRPLVGAQMAERSRSCTKSAPNRREAEAARRDGGDARRGPSPHAGPAARRQPRAQAAPRRGQRRGRQAVERPARQGRRVDGPDRRPLYHDPAPKRQRRPTSSPPGGHSHHGRNGKGQVANGAIAGEIAFEPVPHRKRHAPDGVQACLRPFLLVRTASPGIAGAC